MSIADNQARTFLRLLSGLRVGLRGDAGAPAKFEALVRQNKGLGSRDRRFYRELFYTLLRYLPWLETLEDAELLARIAALCAETPATRVFKAQYANLGDLGSRDRSELLPDWLRAECPSVFEPAHLDLMLSRAPLWLRCQAEEPDEITAMLNAKGLKVSPTPLSDSALRVDAEVDLTHEESYLRGAFEVQDLGSQLILSTSHVAQGGRWLDACAGGGGKTLQLARLLGQTGGIDACDIRWEALCELGLRARRAGIVVRDPTGLMKRAGGPAVTARLSSRDAAITLVRQPGTGYDGVLVDAPCSGSGTWRRSPHQKWCISPESVARASALQRELLQRFSKALKPGGLLIYATCSLCRSENEAVVEDFLAANPGFKLVGEMRNLRPWTHDGDGFFVASLRSL